MRKVIVDTGVWAALRLSRDSCHSIAKRTYDVLAGDSHFYITDGIVSETMTLLRSRGSHRDSVDFWELVKTMEAKGRISLVCGNPELIAGAAAIFKRFKDQDFSFCDCLSFATAKALGIKEAFAFDQHFKTFGLIVYPPQK
jgi:predicted nucleic acid-binding protein